MDSHEIKSEGGIDQGLCNTPDFPVGLAIFDLARAHRGLAAQMLREIGLFPGQEIILFQLWQEDNQSQHCLGRALRLDHSTVAKSMRRLECAGFVTRSRSPDDGRVTMVALTKAGRDLELPAREAWSTLEQITTGGLTEAERVQFVSLSKKLTTSVEASLD